MIGFDGVQHGVGKTSHKPSTNRTSYNLAGLRLLEDSRDASFHFGDERSTEPGTFGLKVLSRFGQLAFCQAVEHGARHSFQPGAGLTKDFGHLKGGRIPP